MDRKPMREEERGALLQIAGELLAIDVALQFVRRQHHDNVGDLRSLGDGQNLEPLAGGLLGGG